MDAKCPSAKVKTQIERLTTMLQGVYIVGICWHVVFIVI